MGGAEHTGCATKQWLLCLSFSVNVDGNMQEVELARMASSPTC